MFTMASRFLPLFGLLLVSLSAYVQAENASTITGISTFYNGDLEITFSLNVDQNSDDINFFLSSPPYSWVGVGFGSGMAGSLMLVFYTSADGQCWLPDAASPFTVHITNTPLQLLLSALVLRRKSSRHSWAYSS
jgi:hypothetical protein